MDELRNDRLALQKKIQELIHEMYEKHPGMYVNSIYVDTSFGTSKELNPINPFTSVKVNVSLI